MKNLIKTALIVAMSISVSTLVAQPIDSSSAETSISAHSDKKVSKKRQVTTTLFLADIDCDACTKKIMNRIPFLRGVKDVRVDLPSKTVSVSYYASKNNDSSIIKAFKQIGISAKVKPAMEVQKK